MRGVKRGEAFQCKGEIPFDRPEASQSHIDRKCRQHTIQIRTVFDPSGNPMYCKCMAQIAHTRLKIGIVANNSSDSAKSPKYLHGCCAIEAFSCGEAELGLIGAIDKVEDT